MNTKTMGWAARLLACSLMFTAGVSFANTWTGGGTSSNASEAANWSGGVPTTGSAIVLDGTSSSKNMNWDAPTNSLPYSVASWLQTNYTGTVTVFTVYGSNGFTNFTITGDCVISNGMWTHLGNTGGETNRLRVTVNGNFTLGSNASINVQGKGYAAGKGPGAGSSYSGNGEPAASYGGMGADAIRNTYGSIVSPINLGSGGNVAGGGAVWLTVNSAATIDGTISAQATQGVLAGGSGGSILIEASSLTGSTNGLLDVSVPYNSNSSSQRGGGGGRIAVILTGSSLFGSVRLKANGGQTWDGIFGAAGTIYLQTSTQTAGTGTLLIDNAGLNSLAQTLMTPADTNLNAFASIIITNKGMLGLNTNTVWNLGNPVNLIAYGPANSFVAAAQTNGLSIPNDWTLSGGYTLRLYTNLNIGGNLTVSNATLELFAGWRTNLHVGGNLLVATNGTISHAANNTNEQYRLALQVDGDLTLASGGAIDVTGKGYTKSAGPGRGDGSNSNNKPGASHGGLAAEWTSAWAYWVTYGSVTAPTNLGSGGIGASLSSGILWAGGGGAAEIRVNGATRLAGSILAKGYLSNMAGSAGGSIFLTTGTLASNGVIDASANATTQYGGGGGRIAVVLTGGDSFDSVTMRAFGSGTYRGAAGTIYRQTASQGAGRGVVTLYGDAATYTTNTVTRIPASTNAAAGEITSLQYVTLTATNYANVAVTTNLTMGDLYLTDDNAKLRLKGYTLTLGAEYHASWGASNRVVFDGGQIVWYPGALGVQALPPSNVGSNFATLNGQVINTGGAENPHTYFCLAYVDAGTLSTGDWLRVVDMGSGYGKSAGFSTNLTSLLRGSTYVYRCYVTNSVGQAWSVTNGSFLTVVLPTVANPGATAVGGHTATLRGQVTDTGGEVPSVGFEYWVNGSSTTTTVSKGTQAGLFTADLGSLLIGSNYTYRCVASNGAGAVWSSASGFQTLSNEYIWSGAGADQKASTPGNWLQGATPTHATDLVRFDSASGTNITWDLTNTVAAWIQTSDYTGTVTIATTYGSSFPSLVVAGDCTVLGGVWTHLTNSAAETYRLAASVGGNFTLGSNASINVQGKGYGAGQGPGAGGSGNYNGLSAASHGGMGNGAVNNTYGSIVAPTNLGSGAYTVGGGAIWLTVDGTATIEGTITAQAAQPSLADGSGGSILIKARTLAGSTNGLLDVSVPYNSTGSGQKGGGGGRIAVKLTGSTSFGSVRMNAGGGQVHNNYYSSDLYRYHGAAGTIYRQTSAQAEGAGTLLIDNGGLVSLAQTLMTPSDSNLNTFAMITITNQGVLGLNTNTVWNLGNPANLVSYGPAQSFVATAQTNGLSIPTDWTLSSYTLRLYTNLNLGGNLTVSNAMLEMYAGWQTNVHVVGNVLVATNGSISHAPNGTSEVYRLALQVDGNLTVAAGGTIDVTGKGYGQGSGPGRGDGNSYGVGAGHGGLAAEFSTPWAYWVTYGSILAPTNLGSGGIGVGGGSAWIQVNGTTLLAGSILAKGLPGTYSGNAGGSISLTTGTLTSNGVIDASANTTANYGGGGGRIAVVLTASDSFGSVSMQAFGAGTSRGAAGTIYRQTASQGTGRGVVTIYGAAATYTTNTVTWIPASTNVTAGQINSLKYVTLIVTNYANVALTTNMTMNDLCLTDDNAKLRLNEHTLILGQYYHESWGTSSRVVYAGGDILWPQGTIYKIR